MVNGRFHFSEVTRTWQVSPYWIELHGFTKLLVEGVDEDGLRQHLLVRFANVGDSWKFAESVPGLRWTYWDPEGRLETVKVKVGKYYRSITVAFSLLAATAAFGFFIWLSFILLFAGITGILITSGVSILPHLLVNPFRESRMKRKRGRMMIEGGKTVITAGQGVWFAPRVSSRKTKNPKRLVVDTGLEKVRVDFSNLNDATKGIELLRKNSQGIGNLVNIVQPN